MIYVQSINGDSIETALKRKAFDALIPIYANERLKLEGDKSSISMRIIDILAPLGKGQRGMIVAPPKAGKTTILKQIANEMRKEKIDTATEKLIEENTEALSKLGE